MQPVLSGKITRAALKGVCPPAVQGLIVSTRVLRNRSPGMNVLIGRVIWHFMISRSNPHVANPNIASQLTEVLLIKSAAGSASARLTNEYCETRGYPAEVIVVHELKSDYTDAMSHSSSSLRPSAVLSDGQPLRRAGNAADGKSSFRDTLAHGVRGAGVELVHDDYFSRVATDLAVLVGEPGARTSRDDEQVDEDLLVRQPALDRHLGRQPAHHAGFRGVWVAPVGYEWSSSFLSAT